LNLKEEGKPSNLYPSLSENYTSLNHGLVKETKVNVGLLGDTLDTLESQSYLPTSNFTQDPSSSFPLSRKNGAMKSMSHATSPSSLNLVLSI